MVSASLARAWEFFLAEWDAFVWPALIFLSFVAAGAFLRRIIFSRLRRWAATTETHADDLLLDALHRPSMLWTIILGIWAATEYSRLPNSVTAWSSKILLGLLIVSITLALAKLAGSMVRVYGPRVEGGMPLGTLAEIIASLLIGAIGFLTLLNAYGISITPLLTALGVGGLAVALALQDTLSNFFAGFYMSLARQIRVGDFVQLESGQRGYVTDIGWRSTTLRELPFNTVIIPNNKLAQSTVTNYSLPEPQTALVMNVGVAYNSDSRHVDRILREVLLKARDEMPGLVSDFEPKVRFWGFGESSIDFQLAVRVTHFEAQLDAQSEIRHRIFERFRDEGIVIPYPMRTIEYRNPPTPGTPSSPPPPAS